jgi:hypothetical protein
MERSIAEMHEMILVDVLEIYNGGRLWVADGGAGELETARLF